MPKVKKTPKSTPRVRTRKAVTAPTGVAACHLPPLTPPAPVGEDYVEIKPGELIPEGAEFRCITGRHWLPSIYAGKLNDGVGLTYRRKVSPSPEPVNFRIVSRSAISFSGGRRIVVERLENTTTNVTITKSGVEVLAFGLTPEGHRGLTDALARTAPLHE